MARRKKITLATDTFVSAGGVRRIPPAAEWSVYVEFRVTGGPVNVVGQTAELELSPAEVDRLIATLEKLRARLEAVAAGSR